MTEISLANAKGENWYQLKVTFCCYLFDVNEKKNITEYIVVYCDLGKINSIE